MIARIKSLIPLPYDSEDGKKAIIHVEVTGFFFELRAERFIAMLQHYYFDANGNKVIIKERNSPYASIEVDSLFTFLNNDIEKTESFSTEFASLITQSLLFEFQVITYEDGLCAYRSQPQDWVIDVQPLEPTPDSTPQPITEPVVNQ
jgi:hypothetical protein